MDSLADTARRIERSACWSLRLLGGFELRALPGGESVSLPGKRERVLLAYLALSPNCRQPRRKLMTLLWGEDVDETTLDNLRTCMWRLRKALNDADHRIVASHEDNIVLDVAAFDVDVLAFRRLAAQSARSELEAATSFYAGEFLAGLDIESEEFASWRRAEATRYRDQAIEALRRLMMLLGECGQTDRATEAGLRLLALDPLHEDAARRVMRLYSQIGRRGAAIQLYHSLAAALRAELDTQPEPETLSIFNEIIHGGQDRAEGSITMDARPSNSMGTARANDIFRERPKLPMRAPVRQRARLAAIAAGLVVGVALTSYLQLAPSGTREAALPAQPVSTLPAGALSIAVLPFSNLSGDAGQEFFSDGLTEEITSALARVRSLKVVARTSAGEFKGQNRDIRTIGEQLGATHLIEGSVRKAGDRVRITVQLITAEDGTLIWSDDFDRQLTDIFLIQEEIARAVASSLQAPLGLRPGENLVNNRAIDSDSYQQFLRGKGALLKASAAFAEQLALLEPVVAKNPNYAPAWAALAQAYAWASTTIRLELPEEQARTRAAYQAKMVAAARRAVELDPDLVEAQVMYTLTISGPRKLALIEDALTHALALDPGSPEALERYSNMLLAVGRVKEALALKQGLHELDPFIPVRNHNLAEALWLDGQTDAAIALLKNSLGRLGRPGIGAESDLARIYASLGRYQDAADTLSLALPKAQTQQVRDNVTAGVRLLRSAPAKAANPENLPRLGGFSFIYLYIGAPERALERYEEGAVGFPPLGYLVHPSYAPVRKTERFKKIMRDQGLVAYWRERGWPSFCHPTTGDDFACD
jgi:TolB-like protein/DNA-binding SARP family transcriptional activator